MLGGAPDLVVPGLVDVEQEVLLDGRHIGVVGSTDETLRLQDHEIGPGRHEIHIAGGRLRFEIVEQVVSTPQAPSLAHPFARSGDAWVPLGPVASLTASDAAWSGATIIGPSAPELRPSRSRPHFKHAAKILAVKCRCDAAVLRCDSPPWLRRASLDMNAVDAYQLLHDNQIDPPAFFVRIGKVSYTVVPFGSTVEHDCGSPHPEVLKLVGLRFDTAGCTAEATEAWTEMLGTDASSR